MKNQGNRRKSPDPLLHASGSGTETKEEPDSFWHMNGDRDVKGRHVFPFRSVQQRGTAFGRD